MFVNGENLSNDTSISDCVAPSTRNLTISFDSANLDFDGLIADLRIYNRALTFQEHLILYTNQYADLMLKNNTARRTL